MPPGWLGKDGVGPMIPRPPATSPWPVPSNPLAISHAPFQDTQPASSGKEWWLDADLDLATEMISCCRCLSLVFTDDVLWIFVVVVVVADAAGGPQNNGASGHMAVV